MQLLWDTSVANNRLQIWKYLELTTTSDSAKAYANAAKAFGMGHAFCREMAVDKDFWLVGSRPLPWWITEVTLSARCDIRCAWLHVL